jgi:hypothetical protein
MNNPATDLLLDMVRQINEIGRRARSGAPGVDDYLEIIKADPTTQWFTDLLRDKNAELQTEKQRTSDLSAALWAWLRAKQSALDSADRQLIDSLRVLGVIEQ